MAKQQAKRIAIDVFDPSRGQDYRIPIGRTGGALFSSLESNCAVVRISWMKGWYVKRIPLKKLEASLLCKVIAQDAAIAFSCVSPKDSLTPQDLAQMGVAADYGDSVLWQFPLNEMAVAETLEKINGQATYEEWLVGSLLSKRHLIELREQAPADSPLDLVFWLSHFSMLGGIWSFHFDTGELLAAFRIFDGYEEVVSAIVENLVG